MVYTNGLYVVNSLPVKMRAQRRGACKTAARTSSQGSSSPSG